MFVCAARLSGQQEINLSKIPFGTESVGKKLEDALVKYQRLSASKSDCNNAYANVIEPLQVIYNYCDKNISYDELKKVIRNLRIIDKVKSDNPTCFDEDFKAYQDMIINKQHIVIETENENLKEKVNARKREESNEGGLFLCFLLLTTTVIVVGGYWIYRKRKRKKLTKNPPNTEGSLDVKTMDEKAFLALKGLRNQEKDALKKEEEKKWAEQKDIIDELVLTIQERKEKKLEAEHFEKERLEQEKLAKNQRIEAELREKERLEKLERDRILQAQLIENQRVEAERREAEEKAIKKEENKLLTEKQAQLDKVETSKLQESLKQLKLENQQLKTALNHQKDALVAKNNEVDQPNLKGSFYMSIPTRDNCFSNNNQKEYYMPNSIFYHFFVFKNEALFEFCNEPKARERENNASIEQGKSRGAEIDIERIAVRAVSIQQQRLRRLAPAVDPVDQRYRNARSVAGHGIV